jgi:mRNA interferase MazF
LPAGRHPVVVITRDTAIPLLANVVVALVTSTIRGLPTEVPLGTEHGLARESVVNCDNLFTIPKRALGRRRGELGDSDLDALRDALTIALGLD